MSERVAALGDGGARDALAALIVEVREALRAHDPQAAVAGLEREIRALGAKVDAIAQGVIDPAAFQRIRAQTEEVRNLLAAPRRGRCRSSGSNGRSANSPTGSTGSPSARRRRPNWRGSAR